MGKERKKSRTKAVIPVVASERRKHELMVGMAESGLDKGKVRIKDRQIKRGLGGCTWISTRRELKIQHIGSRTVLQPKAMSTNFEWKAGIQ